MSRNNYADEGNIGNCYNSGGGLAVAEIFRCVFGYISV